MIAGRDRVVLAAFLTGSVLAGGNAVGVRFSNRELAALWGAGLRFSVAALLLLGVVAALQLPIPRGRALTGTLLYGTLNFAGAFALAYYGLVRVHAGFGQILLALVPLATLLLAVAQGQERLRPGAVLGTVLALAGVALLSRAPLQESVPLLSFVALLGGAVCFAEAAVVVRRFPPVHPVAMNAVGMATGGLLLLIGSVVAGEPAGLPERAPTWIALAYLVLVGSIVVFVLYLFVLRHWAASRAAYAFVISPFVTVVLSAWLDDEPIGPGLVLGGLLILAGVYVGALRAAPKKAPREAATPSSRRGTGVGATVAVVLAAGRGVRLGGVGDGRTKALLPLGGEPIVVRATRPFAAHHAVDEVLVVAPPDEVGRCAAELARADLADVTVIPGGATRHSSEWLAIRGLAARIDRGDIEAVVIHDAARPLYAGEQLEDLLRAALESGGAILAVPIDPEETFARVQDGGAPVPAPTEGTWRAQTPQAFEAGKLLEAFRRAEDEGFEGSDTSSTVERAGVAVRVLHGDPSNIKITYPEDLLLAESFLEWQARPD